MAGHKDAFLRTFIPDSKKRLAELIAFYDETSPGLATDELWKCTELLSTRPSAREILDVPPKDIYTHGRILSYVFANIHQPLSRGDDYADDRYDYKSDITTLNPQVTLSWIKDISLTIADQMADPALKP